MVLAADRAVAVRAEWPPDVRAAMADGSLLIAEGELFAEKQLLRLAEVNQRLRALQGKKEDVFAAVPEDERKRRKVRSEEWVVSGER